MLYLAHFSFENPEGKKRHGRFTCVVDAGGVEEALEKNRRLLTELKQGHDVFEAPVSIYLDDLIEVHKIPSQGFLAHMITSEGPLKNAESHSLPGVDEAFCESFSVETGEQDPETAEISPFIVFEED